MYTEHCDKEVMYLMANLLPFSEADLQQLQRKRYIDSAIVFIVFREAYTSFSPHMVASHSLHAFIVIQPESAPANLEAAPLAAVGK